MICPWSSNATSSSAASGGLHSIHAAAAARRALCRLAARVHALGDPEVAMTVTGCMGFCQAGPIAVVYPEGVWYAPKTAEDVDEIAIAHLGEGKPVERLIIVPRV